MEQNELLSHMQAFQHHPAETLLGQHIPLPKILIQSRCSLISNFCTIKSVFQETLSAEAIVISRYNTATITANKGFLPILNIGCMHFQYNHLKSDACLLNQAHLSRLYTMMCMDNCIYKRNYCINFSSTYQREPT